jgi:uncharacterized membrane protein YkoI
MRLTAGASGLLAAAAFAYGIVQSALAQDARPAPETAAAQATPAPAMPMEEVLSMLKGQGYTDVSDIEREHGRYEVKAKDKEGRAVELKLDAATGKTLAMEEDEDD